MSERKKDFVRSFLQDRLVSGYYSFGQKVSAKDISAETGASRFMVISALNELQAAGFLEITAQVGCEVASPTLAEIRDFFVMFGRMEATLAEFAASRGDSRDLRAIKRANDRLRDLGTVDEVHGEDYRLHNLEFHYAVHAAARSARLAEQQATLWMMADFFVTHARGFREHASESANEHDQVIAAIGRGDERMAGALMETHIRRLGGDVVDGIAAEQSVS